MWDNYLTEDNRQTVINTTTINPITKAKCKGKTIENQIFEESTCSLIYSIAKHFIGEPQLFLDISLKLLYNCTKLDDFTLYEDIFVD